MKKLITSAYRLCFKVIGIKSFCYGVAVIYVSIINMIFLYGAGILFNEWVPFLSVIQKMFSFPFIIGTAAMMLFVTFVFAPKLEDISKESKKVTNTSFLWIYSAAALLILLYSAFIRSGRYL